MIDTDIKVDDTPESKIHQLQIHSSELYAFEPLLYDTIYDYKVKIAELRKRLSFCDDSEKFDFLADIEKMQGKKVILQDIVEQITNPY